MLEFDNLNPGRRPNVSLQGWNTSQLHQQVLGKNHFPGQTLKANETSASHKVSTLSNKLSLTLADYNGAAP